MNEQRIMELTAKIREIFDANFNHSWFYIIVDELPIDPSTVREVRNFLDLSPYELQDMHRVKSGLESLEQLLAKLQRYLLPNIKEILMVSNLNPERKINDKDHFIRMRLLSEVIPYNVEALEKYSVMLSKELYPAVHQEAIIDEIFQKGFAV